MFDIPSIRIGRVFGIPVEVNLSWFVVFALVTYSLSTVVFPGITASSGSPSWLFYLAGASTTLMFFASILAHELSHSVVAKAQGESVDRITLFIFGGVAQIDDEPDTPGREFRMAVAGPAMSMGLSAASLAVYATSASAGAPWWVWAPFEYLTGVNFLVATFNLLPGYPLDGGRVLHALLWAVTRDLLKATRWASRIGQLIGWSMVILAVLGVLRGQADLIWLGLVGWFIASIAGAAYRQQMLRSMLTGVSVSSVMTPGPQYVSGDISVEKLVQEHFLGGRHTRYPVMSDGAIIGVVSLRDAKEVNRADWAFTPVADIANTDLERLVVQHDVPVTALLARLSGERPGALIVAAGGRMVGIVTRADVVALLDGGARA